MEYKWNCLLDNIDIDSGGIKVWGIKDFGHRKQLIKNIEKLIQRN